MSFEASAALPPDMTMGTISTEQQGVLTGVPQAFLAVPPKSGSGAHPNP